MRMREMGVKLPQLTNKVSRKTVNNELNILKGIIKCYQEEYETDLGCKNQVSKVGLLKVNNFVDLFLLP